MAIDVIDHEPIVKQDENAAQVTKETLRGKIEFKNVNFSYPTRKDNKVLKDFNCVFEEGKTTAIVGFSGSGKSTIVQLIERFYDADSGSIEIDGQDIKKLNLKQLRQNIGYVSQEPVLFNFSIRENMHFAAPDATEEEIMTAL